MLGVDDTKSLGSVDVIFNELVAMLQSFFVLQGHHSGQRFLFIVLSLANHFADVIECFAVDPRATEEARALALHFADNFAAVDAVVNQRVLGALAVAHFTSGQLHF